MPELLVLFGPARLARGAQLACLGQENLGDFSQRGVFSKTYSIVAIHIDLNCCALVRGRGVVFRHYYKSIAKCAGKDYRDGAVVPFE